MSPNLTVSIKEYPLLTPFRIARGIRSAATVVVALIEDGHLVGRGECTPYARYGETPERVCRTIMKLRDPICRGIGRSDLQALLPPGAARNALDCALWDLEAKRAALIEPSARVWNLPGMVRPSNVRTVRTISLGSPSEMADATLRLRGNTLKVKLGGRDGEDASRIRAVRAAAPDETLIVDANEGWTVDEFHSLTAAMERAGVAMIEQPLPVGEDSALASLKTSIPLCADESVHSRKDLPRLVGLYQMVNIKLDKAGGLTEALLLRQRAKDLGLGYMVGCMLGSSLAMAPALMVTEGADFVDLDGPLWLQNDRFHGLDYHREALDVVSPLLWG